MTGSDFTAAAAEVSADWQRQGAQPVVC
jgi:hypothetical protein